MNGLMTNHKVQNCIKDNNTFAAMLLYRLFPYGLFHKIGPVNTIYVKQKLNATSDKW
jgi:hypothetical protein